MSEQDQTADQFVSDTDTTDTDPTVDSTAQDAPDVDTGDDGKGVDTGDDENRDDDGSLIDPPSLPSYERELQEASATGDNDAVADVQERYTDAREDHVRKVRERAQSRGGENE